MTPQQRFWWWLLLAVGVLLAVGAGAALMASPGVGGATGRHGAGAVEAEWRPM
ncbi:hypothetical protein [Streptomyces sp. NBRC 109706]|uniref:hypothetical protein n=1 Tax=Streptomyces sp. NBRC 109706 TaxID=1550035 RepID=UPI000A7462A1|nr:hypothetical protein [Streptomyces sp. NBRC 109706]